MTDIKPQGVHPVADLFPMLAEDELRELAEDIKQRGLLHPIVLDGEGRVLDGRNRLAACGLIDVEPEFVTFDGDDPDGYALAVNIQRRNMTSSQRAITVARAVRIAGISQREGSARFKLNQGRIGQANTILDHAPNLADSVATGAMALDEAYRTARDAKKAAEAVEAQLARLRVGDADLAERVVEERMSISDAIALLDASERAAEAEREFRKRVEPIDAIRNADNGPAPSFAARVESGSLMWQEAATLAEQWLTERGEAMQRDRQRIERINSGWGVVRTVVDGSELPYVTELLDSLGQADRDAFAGIIKQLGSQK